MRAWLAELAVQAGPAEVVLSVACPTPRDPSRALERWAAPLPTTVLTSAYTPGRPPLSRAAALNEAAAAARGALLLVLHSDCRLPRGALAEIRGAAGRGRGAGCFAKLYRPGSTLLALQQHGLNAWLRHTRRHAVGTNAIWLRRELWPLLPDQPLLEDFVLWAHLRRVLGAARLHCSPRAVEVSARRYQALGAGRAMLRNALVLFLHRWAAVPAQVLADELYRQPALSPAALARQVCRCLSASR